MTHLETIPSMIPIARPEMGTEERDSVWSALSSGQLAQGARVKEFEERFAAFVGAPYGVATSSGTTALHLALLGRHRPGRRGHHRPVTFTATANPIMHGRPAGVRRRRPGHVHDGPRRLEAAITPRTRAIIRSPSTASPLHAGDPRHRERAGIPVIEDACQAHGASLDGRSRAPRASACSASTRRRT